MKTQLTILKTQLIILLYVCIGAALWLCPTAAEGQTPIARPDLHTDTKIAPLYFGPNAFPVPDMLDDAISPTLQATVAADYHRGDFGDRATDLFARLRLPLFSSRANLVVWLPAVEHYHLTPEWKEHARIADNPAVDGNAVGSAFVSTDLLVLRETKRRPAIALRAAMKTASEDSWTTARYYDCPGYFFDASVGKQFDFEGSLLQSLRFGASSGFLCWQTDNGRQNDATMFAFQVKGRFSLDPDRHTGPDARTLEVSQDLRGYSGWEGDGDCPMVVKTQIAAHFPIYRHNPAEKTKKTGAPRCIISPILTYQKGLRDYPYQQFSAGLTVDFDIFRMQRAK